MALLYEKITSALKEVRAGRTGQRGRGRKTVRDLTELPNWKKLRGLTHYGKKRRAATGAGKKCGRRQI